ncbi:MobA/MobL family protein [Sphingomonas palmae]|uniref:MobA/MobL family protein n=1 Tax=Sphingomonas palmae TaxID=1855283 RepID=A0A1H7KXZ0_9SPHN|nr:MobA/MobL family protein [Sphingomonas palmae]SEK91598.1 MobA/MobL family protein [Sphingomonas palmae]
MVGERAISQKIEAANGRLASLLRAREEDEQLLQIGRVRIKEQAKEEAAKRPASGRGAWTMAADFGAPLPCPGRPRAADGMTTSFHFHACCVTRSSGAARAGGLAANHAAYVERIDAVEIGSALDHAGYVERSDALEVADHALVFSNISNDPDRRRAYWEAVDRCERQGHAGLTIRAGGVGDWLEAVASELPPAFVVHCRSERERWATSQTKGKPFKAKRYHVEHDACEAILGVLRQVPGWPEKEPPVFYTPGSAGRTQYRYVAELPHELGPSDRAAIVRDFCNHLGSFARDAEGRATGMMYTAVIHAPGPGNDKRNFHLHVIAHDRPATWLADHNKWDFEVTEEFVRKGETRIRYPHRQEKIVEVTRSIAPDKQPAHYNAAIAGKAFVPHLRERFAAISNERLALRGIQRRIDSRSHKALGIAKEAEIHLGTRAAALERAGVPTVIGRYNAAASWQYAALTERKRTENFFEPWQQQDDALAKSVAGSPAGADLIRERRAVLRALEETRDLAWENDRLRQQARSRAQATLDYCDRCLVETGGSASHRAAIDKRRWEAEEHLAKVEAAIAAGEADILEAAKAIGQLHLRQVAIDARLAELARAKARLKLVAGLDFSPPVELSSEQQAFRTVGALASAPSLKLVGAWTGTSRPVKREEARRAPAGQMVANASDAAGRTANDEDRSAAPNPSPAIAPRLDKGPPLDVRERIDALLDRIARERIPILAATGKPGAAALSADDRTLLENIQFRYLIVKRLNAIATLQAKEIKRLLDAIKAHGPDLEGISDLKSIRFLLRHWGDHPDVHQALTRAATDAQRLNPVPGTMHRLGAAVSAEVGHVAAKPKGPTSSATPVGLPTRGPER